jgi:hypothetical protein
MQQQQPLNSITMENKDSHIETLDTQLCSHYHMVQDTTRILVLIVDP